MSSDRREYEKRVNAVIDYIRERLAEELSLRALARVAAFSPFHFHRVFRAITGGTLFGFIQRQRIEDHWVCEYWHAPEERWILVDAQIDELQRGKLQADFDLCDVPRGRFVIAGDAWARCRAGEADPARFGIFGMRGLWFIAANLLRDAAALNNMEMLPWDVWGAMTGPDQPVPHAELALFDRLAVLTRAPDPAFAELRARYEDDDRLRVPATVHNAVLNREEAI